MCTIIKIHILQKILKIKTKLNKMTDTIQNTNTNTNYNDVIKNLQDYMLDEANIKKALEMKIESTNKQSNFKDKVSL